MRCRGRRAVEQAQLGYLARNRGDLGGTVVVRGPHEREQTGPGDLPDGHRSVLTVDTHRRACDPLEDRAHQRRPPFARPGPRPSGPRLRMRTRTRTGLS